jgi:ABC-type nitrate/sulfonate/bicarbonate transport system substrate-binding protein
MKASVVKFCPRCGKSTTHLGNSQHRCNDCLLQFQLLYSFGNLINECNAPKPKKSFWENLKRLLTLNTGEKMKRIAMLMLLVAGLAGCSKTEVSNSDTPSFSLAWSEYPSWSVFGVADAEGLIDGDEGKLGPIEKKWNVDIVLKEADYDTCMTLYGSNTVDAACLTSLDTLAPSHSRASVAIAPTSTSVGADACIVVGEINKVEDLKGIPTYGLDKSVSRYAHERNLILKGLNPVEFPFKNMDPAAAAQAMQTNQEGIQSIMVWNPFVLQTLRTREGAKVLFSSDTIPEEIVDCVIVGADSLKKPGGENFACAVLDAFYAVNKLIADPATHDKTLVALGAKFSSLGLEDMETVVTQTRFYSTPDKALALFGDNKFQTVTTPAVVKFCEEQGIVDKKDSAEKQVGFNDESALLNFTDKYIKLVEAKQ